MTQRSRYTLYLLILGALFYLPFLGGVHLFDWDEINFAEISREMIVLNDYLRIHIDYRPFYEKPPLFFWLQVIPMKLFGVNELSARLPNAICGILTLILLFRIGTKLFDSRFGFIWALAYFGSVLPFLYFKSGIIDPVFNLFIFIGIYLYILSRWKNKQAVLIKIKWRKFKILIIGGLSLGLAMLTKGPAAIVIFILVIGVYNLIQLTKKRQTIQLKSFFEFSVFILFSVLTTFIWFGIETWQNGLSFIEEFIRYQIRLFGTADAGHAGFPGFHVVVLLIGCFPASIFAIRSFFKFPDSPKEHQKDFVLWMKILFWVVLILFSIVNTKIIHYSSLCYFPISFLAALVISRIISGQMSFNGWMRFGIISIGGLFILATTAAPFIGKNIDSIKHLFHNDAFAVANLEADVSWSGFECLTGILLLVCLTSTLYLISINKLWAGFRVLFLGTGIFVLTGLICFVGRIEGYTQRAAINFFKSKSGEDCYVVPYGYKTYGHLFYQEKPAISDARSSDKYWLLTGEVEKPVYIITKIHKAEKLQDDLEVQQIKSENGFVFFRRSKLPESN